MSKYEKVRVERSREDQPNPQEVCTIICTYSHRRTVSLTVHDLKLSDNTRNKHVQVRESRENGIKLKNRVR